MQMTPSPFKRDNEELYRLFIGIRTTIDPYLTDFGDEKFYCILQVR